MLFGLLLMPLEPRRKKWVENINERLFCQNGWIEWWGSGFVIALCCDEWVDWSADVVVLAPVCRLLVAACQLRHPLRPSSAAIVLASIPSIEFLPEVFRLLPSPCRVLYCNHAIPHRRASTDAFLFSTKIRLPPPTVGTHFPLACPARRHASLLPTYIWRLKTSSRSSRRRRNEYIQPEIEVQSQNRGSDRAPSCRVEAEAETAVLLGRSEDLIRFQWRKVEAERSTLCGNTTRIATARLVAGVAAPCRAQRQRQPKATSGVESFASKPKFLRVW